VGSQQNLGNGVQGAFLSAAHEFLGLNLSLAPSPGSWDFFGSALLHKAPFRGDKLFPAGVSLTSGFTQAIRYVPPAAGAYALSAWQPSGAGKLVTSGGGAVNGLNLPFTASVSSAVHFTSQTSSPKLALSPLTGFFGGSVKPASHAAAPFTGILYQGTLTHSLGIGNFVADGKPGAVTLSGP
jgi:hypothetical protein